MPDQGNAPPGVGELSRQVRDVLARFEGLVNKLETQFVGKDIFQLYSEGVARELSHLVKTAEQQASMEKQRSDQLEQRVSKLEANNTWIVRTILAVVVVAVLAAVGFSKARGGG